MAGGAALAMAVAKAKDEDAKEEEEQKKGQMAAGETLAEVATRVKTNEDEPAEETSRDLGDEDEKHRQDQVAAGETLAEVAERVKTNESEPAQEPSQDVASSAARDAIVIAPVAATAPAEESVEPMEELKEEPRQVTREPTKEKPERRSMFGSISNRFKRKPKDEPVASEPKRSVESAEPPVKEEEKHDDGAAAPTIGLQGAGLAAAAGIEEEHLSPEQQKTSLESAEDKQDEGAAAPVIGTQGAGLAAAGGVEEEHASPEEEKRSLDTPQSRHNDGIVIGPSGSGPAAAGGVEDEQATRDQALDDLEDSDDEDEDVDRVQMAGAIAGTAALGAVIAAGSVAAEHRNQTSGIDEEEHISEVSSLSTADELSDSADDRDLQGVTTAQEHSGAYNFAEPSPAMERGRPDLYRHISTLESSSSSERESLYDVTDEDDERGRGRLEPRPTMHEEFQEREGVPARDTPLIISETVPAAVAEEPDSPVSPLHEGHQDEEDPAEDGKVVVVNKEAPPDAPHPIVAPAPVPYDSASVAESEPGAPAPVVKSGPSVDERKQDKGKLKKEEKKEEKTEEKKEGGGVRGFFRKLKNKTKADNKLQKRQSSATGSESSLRAASASKESETKAPEPAPVENTKDEEFITPVTTTTAALEQEQHVGTDGPIGDPKHISGIGGDPRPTSPSSFKRYDAESRDLDDVSSSGADEDDVSRGRAGRLVKKLGLKKDKSKESEGGEKVQSSTSNSREDQFEEAEEGRDHFDESLAPPPAFGGQMKSGSPVRETRFQEQL